MTDKSFEDQNQGRLLDVAVSSHDGINSTQIKLIEDPSLSSMESASQPEFYISGVVDTRERARFLLTALDNLAQANKYQGYAEIETMPLGHTKLESAYEAHLPTVTQEVAYKAKTRPERAKEAFIRAYTLGTEDAPGITSEATEAYKVFRQEYGGTGERAKTRSALKKRLEKELQTAGPRAVGDSYQLVPETPPKTELLEANTVQKLEALRDDKRACFLPATNTEKNQAVELLDYMDNPKYPGGVYHRLHEIAQRRFKDAQTAGASIPDSKEEGRTAVKSVLGEYGDHRANAIRSVSQLKQLKEVIDATDNPALSLKDTLQDNTDIKGLSARELVRYIDGLALISGQEPQSGMDPLRTRKNRQIHVGPRNKTIEDRYTTTMPIQEFEEYIDQRLKSIRVVTARKVIDSAIVDQTNRANFWHNTLASVSYGYRRFAEDVLRIAS